MQFEVHEKTYFKNILNSIRLLSSSKKIHRRWTSPRGYLAWSRVRGAMVCHGDSVSYQYLEEGTLPHRCWHGEGAPSLHRGGVRLGEAQDRAVGWDIRPSFKEEEARRQGCRGWSGVPQLTPASLHRWLLPHRHSMPTICPTRTRWVRGLVGPGGGVGLWWGWAGPGGKGLLLTTPSSAVFPAGILQPTLYDLTFLAVSMGPGVSQGPGHGS